MHFIIFATIVLLTGNCTGRFKVSNPNTMEDFSFLVGGDDIHLSLKTVHERINLVIGLNITVLTVKQTISSILQTIQAWEAYPPFHSDENLKMEYLSMTSAGLVFTRKMIGNMNKILEYLPPQANSGKSTYCEIVARNVSIDKFTRAEYNLAKRWSHIENSWTPASIRTDKSQANVLLMFANYLTDMGTLLFEESAEILLILEQLSDNHFPEILRPDIENSICVPGDAGESYSVKTCEKLSSGFNCILEIIMPKQLETYVKLHRVHYSDIRLQACPQCYYVQEKSSGTVKFANCTIEKEVNMDFPVCVFATLEDSCLRFLQSTEISQIIQNCRFETHSPDLVTLLPNSGSLIQGGTEITVSSGTKAVIDRLPIVIFSPDNLTISHGEQEISVPGNSNLTSLTVVKSLLTDDDVENLKRKLEWDDFADDWGTDDLVRFCLLGLQIFILPISAGFSIYIFIKTKGNAKRNQEKTNFEETRKILKTRKK